MINGRKWYITAGEAAHFILVARTSDDPRKAFRPFCSTKTSQSVTERRIPIMGLKSMAGIARSALTGWKSMRITG